jgi:very-short-patch-repair endonuclease
MTPGETKLWQYLRKKQILGFDFDRQRPIDQFIVDFYCKDLMLAIEIDGSSHDSEFAKVKDLERQRRLEGFGVTVIRFTESETLQKTEFVVATIEAYIRSHQRS